MATAAAASSGSSGAASVGKKARRRRGGRSSSATATAMPKNLGWVGARRREWGRWAAELRVPNTRERLWIGTFATPKEAAHAYDAAVFCFYGDNIPRIRRLNFPTAPRPDVPEDVRAKLTVANIKAIAEKYARDLADYIPPPPVFLEAAPQVVEAAPAAVDASIGVGAAPTADYGSADETAVDMSIADCLLSFNDGPVEFDDILNFENIK